MKNEKPFTYPRLAAAIVIYLSLLALGFAAGKASAHTVVVVTAVQTISGEHCNPEGSELWWKQPTDSGRFVAYDCTDVTIEPGQTLDTPVTGEVELRAPDGRGLHFCELRRASYELPDSEVRLEFFCADDTAVYGDGYEVTQ